MPRLINYLTAIYFLSGDWGKFILLAVFLVGFLILLSDLRGRFANKKKSLGDKAVQKMISDTLEKIDLHGPLRDGYIRYWHTRGSEGLTDQQIILQNRLLDGGLDWILETCLIRGQNWTVVISKPAFSQIKKVAAAWAGYVKDVRGPEDNYRWIVELQNDRFMYIKAFFDPSGFYSNIKLFIRLAGTAEKAALFEIQPKTLARMNKDQVVYNALLDQIKSGERDWAGFKSGTDYSV